MAKIQEGEQVCILHTGEVGILKRYLTPYTVMVDVNGDYREVAVSALEPAWLFNPNGKKPESRKSNQPEKIARGIAGMPTGIHLLFRPEKNMAGELLRYTVLLLNRCGYDLRLHYTFHLDGSLHTSLRKDLETGDDLVLHEFKTDQLNDLPSFTGTFWLQEKAGGLQHEFSRELRIKPKQFFGGQYLIENTEMLLFPLVEQLPFKEEKSIFPKSEKDTFDWGKGKKPKPHAVIEKAQMPDFIDLHIEKLDPAWELLSKGEMLELQLDCFREFLEKAIQLRLHKIYAVHGLGKGVLREAIARLLEQYPSVTSFNNQYHARFGHGATEIILD
jgi:hypothetical protein